MAKYRKKPITVTAVQYKASELLPDDFAEASREYFIDHENRLVLNTHVGEARPRDGDYIVRGAHGELYAVKREIFESNYELVK